METTSGIPNAKQQFICNRKEKTNFQKKLPKQTNNPSIVRGVPTPKLRITASIITTPRKECGATMWPTAKAPRCCESLLLEPDFVNQKPLTPLHVYPSAAN